MTLLILGGTRFVGLWLAEQALVDGHRVTVLHRTPAPADVLPGAEHLIANRDGGLAILGDRRWDAVVDTCGYVPRVVRASAEALCDRADVYLFISSISVYADPLTAGFTEDAPLAVLEDPATEEVTGPAYGGLKALCEGVVREVYGDRGLVIRPGLIVGPRDYTDRFAYWVRRIADGGEVLAPGDPDLGVQFVDARDLAAFALHALTTGQRGVFHATGPAARLSFATFLEAIRAAVASEARFTWIGEAFLLEAGVHPWSELPLWVTSGNAAFCEANVARARQAGLRFRPLADTVRDTLAWERALPPAARAGSPSLTRERESALLHDWHARAGAPR